MRLAFFPALVSALSTSLAWLVLACSSTGSSNAGDDRVPNCTTDAGNAPECPETYDYRLSGACPRVGLSCTYPGYGDSISNGCRESAAAICVKGADGGSGRWVTAQ